MGRDLTAYSRDQVPPNLYDDPQLAAYVIDLPGFSAAVESYEYSKQPMNNLAFESGAGTSLVFAPLVDVDSATGSAALAHLVARVQHYATGANATGKFVFAPATYPTNNSFGNTNPSGAGVAAGNALGWPGMWPTLHVFRSFDPAIAPTSAFDLRCELSSDDTPGEQGATEFCADYECDATTLHLPDRASQIDATITPGADGFSGWKYGLWVLNYLQVMHDTNGSAVVTVASDSQATVGAPNNQIIGTSSSGMPTAAGTFLGSSDIEGFQAQLLILELEARADDWLMHLTTTDGVTLSGFASVADALAYNDATPLRWFPGAIAVTETPDTSGFPRPAYTVASPDSELLDLLGVAMAYAELYALTDTANPDVGGAQAARTMFDNDPFPADDQLADGESTLHDRALAMMRVALVNLDRLHTDPASGQLVDTVTLAHGVVARGTTISTTSVAYSVIGLRTALRSLSSQLELYSNNTTDTAITTTPLDAFPLASPGAPSLTFGARLEQLLRANSDLLLEHLTDATGRAWDGWNVATGAPIDEHDVLDAHTAAIRGLFAGYLATGDVRYRDRALVVFQRVDAVFYDPDARIYAETAAPATSVEYTPLRFALLQSALRDVYELVAARPGGEALEPVLEERLARLDKLVLDGWDDRDRDQQVSTSECVVSPYPSGGLQMAERTLTGELGRGARSAPTSAPTNDRDGDCVPEIDDAHLPSALAGSITFQITRP
jgi:hypothetical protein